MINSIKISKSVLSRLCSMDTETKNNNSFEHLIIPIKIQANGTKIKNRISEQELRLLFIEELKKEYPDLFFSIETPTVKKYSFGKLFNDIKLDTKGQSGSIDLCIFERDLNSYKRILNVEFKHKNVNIHNIGKDILKLIAETCNGLYIHLLENTKDNTLKNDGLTGVFDKLFKSFNDSKKNWKNSNQSIQIIIISLKQKTIISRVIKKNELNNLDSIFFQNSSLKNINNVKGNGWI